MVTMTVDDESHDTHVDHAYWVGRWVDVDPVRPIGSEGEGAKG